ncbi:MAG: acyltransferase, partial [Bdellovibrionales bacterium]|nr:acyltransferase [Bdellovibrionales bacterium]
MQIPDFSYKQHIDGIRALAVVSVILFHLNPAFFPGGYLGVDVFFVISGFVITQSLYKNYCVKGRIEIYEFYVKRFKRLYPALVFMVFTTTFAYVFFGFLWDTNLFLKSVVTSIFATSNLYFLYHGENYFHQDLVNPLLHTWSLGVEEQFYVVYPLLLALGLWLVTKFKLKPIILGLIFLISSVLLYVLFSSSGDIIFNSFYSPLTRFWELGAGCALFFLSQYFSFDKFNQTTTVISFLCILGITFFQSDINNFKTETLAIVLATSVLIFAGINSKSLISRFLSHKFTTHIGRISYSLYLWHFPVIYFAYLYLDKTWAYILAIIVMVGLAEFSYSYIEKPLRYSESFELMLRKAVKVSPYLLATAVLSVSVIGQGNVRTGINQTFNSTGEKIKPINYIESNFNLGERIQPRYTLNGVDASSCADVSKSKYLTKNEQGLFDTCMKQSDDKTLFFLTGDSHSF